jgi:undecaprenyl-diphosphatase
MHIGSIQFWEIALLIITETLLSLILFSAVIILLVFFLRRPMQKYKPVDLAVFEKLQPFVNPTKNRIILFITFLGNHKFLIPANLLLICYFIFIAHENWFTVRVITIALSSLVLMLLLKFLFQRKRPLSPLLKAARGLSFPSGHAIMAVTFYGLLLHILLNVVDPNLLKWFFGVLLISLIFLIGYSRVYLRVHYASDVIAGFIIGVLWLLVSLYVLDQLEKISLT